MIASRLEANNNPKGLIMPAETEKYRWMYETMVLIRYYEETMARVYMEGNTNLQSHYLVTHQKNTQVI